jgi:hypothetical protein
MSIKVSNGFYFFAKGEKMTNAEKFEEVFGMKIDEDYPKGICQSIDHKICIEHNCSDCPAFKFWDREYKEETNG